MKLSIYYGKSQPMVAVGKNQVHCLGFAEKYPGWHSFGTDRATRAAVYALAKKGYLELSGISNQFRITYP